MTICAFRARSLDLSLGCESDTVLRFSSRPSQLQSRASSAHPGTHTVTKWGLSRDLAGTTPIYTPGNQSAKDPTLYPCSSTTLLKKVLQATLSTRDLAGHMPSRIPDNKPTNCRSHCKPQGSLLIGSSPHSGNLISLREGKDFTC